MQIADNDTKVVNVTDDTMIFLREFSCFVKKKKKRKKLELRQKGSNLKISFQKPRPYGL